MHPWVGAGDDDRLRILHELGLESIDQLFASIPSEICVDLLELPTARDEETVRLALSRMSTANLSIDCAPSFLGAGVCHHVQPSVVDAVLSRSELCRSGLEKQEGLRLAITTVPLANCIDSLKITPLGRAYYASIGLAD